MANDSLEAFEAIFGKRYPEGNLGNLVYDGQLQGWQAARSSLQPVGEDVQNNELRMRLAQIASGDYKLCGHTAEQVAADALLGKPLSSGAIRSAPIPSVEAISNAASECAHQLRESIDYLTHEGFHKDGIIIQEMEAAITAVQKAIHELLSRA